MVAKLYGIALLLVLVGLACWAFYSMGKESTEKKKPDYNGSIDEKIQSLKKQIEEIEGALPEEIALKQASLDKLKEELELAKKYKEKLNSNI